jgi:hypothetical protein
VKRLQAVSHALLLRFELERLVATRTPGDCDEDVSWAGNPSCLGLGPAQHGVLRSTKPGLGGKQMAFRRTPEAPGCTTILVRDTTKRYYRFHRWVNRNNLAPSVLSPSQQAQGTSGFG